MTPSEPENHVDYLKKELDDLIERDEYLSAEIKAVQEDLDSIIKELESPDFAAEISVKERERSRKKSRERSALSASRERSGLSASSAEIEAVLATFPGVEDNVAYLQYNFDKTMDKAKTILSAMKFLLADAVSLQGRFTEASK